MYGDRVHFSITCFTKFSLAAKGIDFCLPKGMVTETEQKTGHPLRSIVGNLNLETTSNFTTRRFFKNKLDKFESQILKKEEEEEEAEQIELM
ncbi:uncharacterized protein G2W53_021197 [Senna tora]|uniref:Uncharacterized protein n=1 Tax=Senna tora TaxID=362788 RepID=A0A834WJC3_9FABA|nr:uncharacterized protein G2W53_021197 [Senna tora]